MHVIKQVLVNLAIPYELINDGHIIFGEELPDDLRKKLEKALLPYSIKITYKDSASIVEQIKDCVRMVVASDTLRKKKLSSVLSEKLGYSYSHLSALFSNATYTTIENFYIFIRIEKAKEMLMEENMRLNVVAYNLDYSSVSHLSRQFKNLTGLTVSQYLKLVANRKIG